MSFRDLMLWAVAGLVLALSIVIVLLGAGCSVYDDMPAECVCSCDGGAS